MRSPVRIGLAACLSVAAIAAANAECLSAAERDRISQNYTKYATQFDLMAIAKELMEQLDKTSDLSERLDRCREAHSGPDAGSCDAMAEELRGQQARQAALADRLNLAYRMQEYIATLKLRLERPDCKPSTD